MRHKPRGMHGTGEWAAARDEVRQLKCAVPGCEGHRIVPYMPWCAKHRSAYLHTGHPQGVAVRQHHYKTERTKVAYLFDLFSNNPALLAAETILTQWTTAAAKDFEYSTGPGRNYKTHVPARALMAGH